MKKILLLIISAALFFSLTACKAKPEGSSSTASGSSSSVSSVSGAASSASSSAASSSSSSQASGSQQSQPASQSNSLAVADIESWPTSFVSINDKNGADVLIELKAPGPDDWEFDGIYTFFQNGKKVMEIAGVEIITDKANPFEAAYNEKYTKTPEGVPEGFGYISSEKIKLKDCSAVLHLWKMWPDDSENPWYPHNYFVEKDGYLVMVNFYTYEEKCSSLHKTYDAILNNLSVFK